MKSTKWIVTIALGLFVITGSVVIAKDHEGGNGKGKGHDKQEDDGDRAREGEDRGHEKHSEKRYYKTHDRELTRSWYMQHQSNLPPGLAKRDQLPPGLQKQLEERGSLPSGLERHLQPVPQELEVRLTPPPPECTHVLIGGNIVMLNRRTNIVVDVFHY
ncbi:MAG: hypothetical protein M3N22_03880 [Acidobacteriota bacterium]|nr:hypothetical protein [Acidobacteriota bacterium]